jgi:hypothetical protein
VLVLRSDGLAWQNQADPLDVNVDTFISPIDALVIINELNDRQFSESNGELPVPPTPPQLPPPFFDVTGDDFVSPIDVLVVINFLNERAASESEGSFVAINERDVHHSFAGPRASPATDSARESRGEPVGKASFSHLPGFSDSEGRPEPQRRLDERRLHRVLFASSSDLTPELISTSLLDELAKALYL